MIITTKLASVVIPSRVESENLHTRYVRQRAQVGQMVKRFPLRHQGVQILALPRSVVKEPLSLVIPNSEEAVPVTFDSKETSLVSPSS